MLRMDSKNINFNGSSVIDDVAVANFGANHDGNNVYFNMSVSNIELYKEYKSSVEVDFSEFCNEVLAAAAK